MNNAIIIGALLGLAAITAGTMRWFRSQIDRATNEMYTVIKDDLDAVLLELKNRSIQGTSAIRVEIGMIHDRIIALAEKDFSHVITAKNDITAALDGLHAKIDGIAETTHAAVHSAAAASLLAARRTCAFCNRVVHSFEVEAGIVKCTDCKSQGR